MPDIAHTGCQWRYLPEPFGPWTRIWSQFRRWSRNGTGARALTVLPAAVRPEAGRAEETPSMVVIDTHLARGRPHPDSDFRRLGRGRLVTGTVAGIVFGLLAMAVLLFGSAVIPE